MSSKWKRLDKSFGLYVNRDFNSFNFLFIFLLLFSYGRLIGTVIQCNATFPSCATFIACFYMDARIMLPLICVLLELYVCLYRRHFFASVDTRNVSKTVRKVILFNNKSEVIQLLWYI